MRNTSRLLIFWILLSFGIALPTPSYASSFSSCIKIILEKATVYGATLQGIEVLGNVYQTCQKFSPTKVGQYLPQYKLQPHGLICSGPPLRSRIYSPINAGWRLGTIKCKGGSYEFGATGSFVTAYLPEENTYKNSNPISHNPIAQK